MRTIAIGLGFALFAALPASIAFARQPALDAPVAASTRTAPAQRYATDATLREQMREIRDSVLALEHAPHGHINPELASQAADRITGNVNIIIVNCKLPADADAALHDIIGPILKDANALKSDSGRTDAVAGLRESLARYARQFRDPGFSVSGK